MQCLHKKCLEKQRRLGRLKSLEVAVFVAAIDRIGHSISFHTIIPVDLELTPSSILHSGL